MRSSSQRLSEHRARRGRPATELPRRARQAARPALAGLAMLITTLAAAEPSMLWLNAKVFTADPAQP